MVDDERLCGAKHDDYQEQGYLGDTFLWMLLMKQQLMTKKLDILITT
jgi:hypothetical protein